MKNIYGIDQHRQPDSALSGRENSGARDPGLAPRRWSSAAPAPGFTLEPLRGSDIRTTSLLICERSRSCKAPQNHSL